MIDKTINQKELRWDMFVLLWVLVMVFITTWPWSDFRGHSHWDQVIWIPFYDMTTSPFFILNIFGNILLFVPFGFFLAKFLTGIPQTIVLRSIIWSSLMSMCIELFQVYCHGHFPTMTDLSSNVIGAGLGAKLGKGRYQRYVDAIIRNHVYPIFKINQ